VEGTARQSSQAFFDQRTPAVNQSGNVSAILLGPSRNTVDVGLVWLADVGGVRARDGSLVAHPRDGHRRVETARESNTNSFTDGE
jgi:hypothetical protein